MADLSLNRNSSFLLPLCLVFLFQLSSFASRTDSLLRLLPSSKGKARIAMLNALARENSEDHPEKAIAWSTEALKLSRASGNQQEEARALRNLGDAALAMDNFTEAIGYFEQSSVIEKSLNGSTSGDYIDRIGDIGYCYLMSSQYEQALRYFQMAADLAEAAGNQEEVANNFSNIATIYIEWGDYAEAVAYLQKALELDRKEGNYDKLSTTLNNIGKMNELLGKFEEAMVNYQEALELERRTGNQAKIAIRLSNLGTASKGAGKYQEALSYFQQAMEIERSLGIQEKVAKRLHHIGATYFAMKELDKSKAYYDQALAIYLRLELHDDLARLYNNYGSYYNDVKSYDEAIEYLNQSQILAKENNLNPLQISNLELLTVAYEKTGRHDHALDALRNVILLKDSLFSSESTRKLSEFRARFENEKIRLENEELANDARIKRNLTLFAAILSAILVVVLVLVVFVFRLRVRNSRQARLLAEQESERFKLDLEMRNQELTYNAMCIIRNNETLARVIGNIEQLIQDGKAPEHIEGLLHEIRGMENENSWKEFEVRFTQVHKDFYEKLNKDFPQLTPNEKKLCAFLRLNMTTKDIASITHQSVHSINVARTRLRKKMNLANSDENLIAFLMKY